MKYLIYLSHCIICLIGLQIVKLNLNDHTMTMVSLRKQSKEHLGSQSKFKPLNLGFPQLLGISWNTAHHTHNTTGKFIQRESVWNLKAIMKLHFSWCVVFASVSAFVSYGYEIPEPKIDVLKPRGFRISIPHEDGIRIFSFHGNVNKEMDGLEAGDMSQDILQQRNGRWTFEEPKTKLKKGDIVYYWLYIEKDGLGYRLDDASFVFNGELMCTYTKIAWIGNLHKKIIAENKSVMLENEVGKILRFKYE